MRKFFNISKLNSSLFIVGWRERHFRFKKLSRLKYDEFPHNINSSILCNWPKISSSLFWSIVFVVHNLNDFKEDKFLIEKCVSVEFLVPNRSFLSEESPSM